jgi:alpha-tubulin suppressor-like RCC1 family protein
MSLARYVLALFLSALVFTASAAGRRLPPPAPLAANDRYFVQENTGSITRDAAHGVLWNDANTSGFTVNLVSPTNNGTLFLNTDGSFLYTPNPDFTGIDTFSYNLVGGSTSNTATVSFSVLPPTIVIGWGAGDVGQINTPGGLSTVVQIAAGSSSTFVLKGDGTVVGWGSGGFGVLSIPAGLSNVVQIKAGFGHCLALKADGTVVAWGDDTWGQIDVPVGLSNVIQVSAGHLHSLALKADGTVVAWGSNGQGETTVPGGLSGVVQIATGEYHSLALKSDGTVVAWGDNAFGESTVPAGLSNVVQVSSKHFHSFALKSDGTVVVWGDNTYGQNSVPAGLSTVTQISEGYVDSLALNADGSVVGWGDDSAGQDDPPSYIHNVLEVAGGSFYSLALQPAPLAANDRYFIPMNTGSLVRDAAHGILLNDANTTGFPVILVGNTTNGTLSLSGDGSFSYTPNAGFSGTDSFTYELAVGGNIATATIVVQAPNAIFAWGFDGAGQTDVPNGLANVVQVSAGGGHSLALKPDGTVAAWGDNTSGQITIPGGLSSVVQVSAGSSHSLALKADGTVVAWGDNAFGQSTVPAGLTNVIQVAAGGLHSIALRADGTVVAWGDNFNGQAAIPSGLTGVIQVGAGNMDSFALKADGTVVGWGSNTSGQISIPIGLSGVVQVSPGVTHVLALKADGTVVAWGDDTSAQSDVPIGLSGVAQVGGGGLHSLALKANGSVVGWGSNSVGQITIPVSNAIQISAGQAHSLALQPAAIANNDSRSVNENAVLSGSTVVANDNYAVGYTANLVVNGAHGVAQVNGDGTFTYTPTTGYHGPDSFSYNLTSGSVTSNTAIVSITVGQIPMVANVSLTFSSVEGAVGDTGTVNLDLRDPGTGTVVTLSSSDTTVAQPDASITITSASSGNFNIVTHAVALDQTVTITATANGNSKTTSLTVSAARVSSVTFTQMSVLSGSNVTATVVLTSPAAAAGDPVNFHPSGPITTPISLSIAGGQTSANFVFVTQGVTTTTTATLGVSRVNAEKSGSIDILAANLSSMTPSVDSLLGGNEDILYPVLNGEAGPQYTLFLSSQDTNALTVQPTYTIPQNTNSGSFRLKTLPVSIDTGIAVSANDGHGHTITRIITVLEARVSYFTAGPSTVTGGRPLLATVSLAGFAGPTGDLVTITSNKSAVTGTSGNVVSGESYRYFQLQTRQVDVPMVVTLTAVTIGASKTCTVTVNPATPSALGLNFSGVDGLALIGFESGDLSMDDPKRVR